MGNHLPPLDPAFMDMALELAIKSRPSPNPRVGAVVVKDGKVIGRGFHKQPGMPHAEIVALTDAGEASRGADMYVTLEPCCHHGKTGPCVETLAAAGIRRVAIGMVDPDPLVNGKGISRLKQLEIDFEVDIQKQKCQRLLEGYATHRIQGRPLFTLKAAVTLDGALATTTGDSKWISSKASRTIGHRMRAEADAVLVGVKTAIIDDPELTVRLCSGPNPVRIVMDSKLKTPPSSKLIMTASQAPVLLAHTDAASAETVRQLSDIEGVDTLKCNADKNGLIDPVDMAGKLALRGILSVLVEGGSQVHGAFASSGLADRVALFISPKVIGGGLRWISFPGITSIKDALTLDNLEIIQIDSDLLLEGRFVPSNP